MPSLLIAGGLTVDHFADGTRAPGGSVLHAGLAAAAEGAEITMLTVAGDEPEAREGLTRLAGMGRVLRHAAPASTTYVHRELERSHGFTYIGEEKLRASRSVGMEDEDNYLVEQSDEFRSIVAELERS